MPWVDIAQAVLRRWVVFLVVLAVTVSISFSIRTVGSEFIALSTLTVISPPTDNPLLDSTRPEYIATTIVAVFELYDDTYRDELRAEGFSDDFSIDFFSRLPLMTIETKAPTHAGVRASADRISEDFVARIDAVQAERGVPQAARLGGAVLEVTQPPRRPAGSNRGLAGLLVGSIMISGASAYGFDQFVAPWATNRRRVRQGASGPVGVS